MSNGLINNLIFNNCEKVKRDTSFCLEESLKKATNGDIAEQNRVAEHFTGLVVKFAMKYSREFGYEFDDVFSVGCCGLIRATKCFDFSRNVKFTTFASTCIINEIITWLKTEKHYIDKNIVCLKDEAKKIGMADENSEVELFDYFMKNEPDTANIVESQSIIDDCSKYLKKNLKPFHYEVADMYFGFSNGAPLTQSEITKIVGISRANCSLIVNKSKALLAKYCKKYFNYNLGATRDTNSIMY